MSPPSWRPVLKSAMPEARFRRSNRLKATRRDRQNRKPRPRPRSRIAAHVGGAALPLEPESSHIAAITSRIPNGAVAIGGRPPALHQAEAARNRVRDEQPAVEKLQQGAPAAVGVKARTAMARRNEVEALPKSAAPGDEADGRRRR